MISIITSICFPLVQLIVLYSTLRIYIIDAFTFLSLFLNINNNVLVLKYQSKGFYRERKDNKDLETKT